MKASFKIEAVGDNTEQMMRLWTGILDMGMPGFGEMTIGKPLHSYWVAQITGFDSKYKYARQFIRGKKDYSQANSKGSRGVFVYYLLESGYVYEIKKSSKRRLFGIVDQDGDIVEVDKEYVDQWINDHSASIPLKPQGNE